MKAIDQTHTSAGTYRETLSALLPLGMPRVSEERP
jgi:hypothetical protein